MSSSPSRISKLENITNNLKKKNSQMKSHDVFLLKLQDYNPKNTQHESLIKDNNQYVQTEN